PPGTAGPCTRAGSPGRSSGRSPTSTPHSSSWSGTSSRSAPMRSGARCSPSSTPPSPSGARPCGPRCPAGRGPRPGPRRYCAAPGSRRVVGRAPGKINLSLGVGAVDERGYHALATVFQAVDLYETITAVRADELSLEISSDVPGEVPLDETNLALQAAELLREEFSLRE